MIPRQTLAVLAMAASLVPDVVSAQSITFAETPLGTTPKDFQPMQTGIGNPGHWEVVADDGATGGKAVSQASQDQTDTLFPLLIYMPTVPADIEVAMRLKLVSGKVDQAGGLAIALENQVNYYVVRANALEGNVRFYKVVAGKREQIAGANVPVVSDQWHELSVSAQGDRFTVRFDGRDLFSATDRTFGAPGKVAFWTKADSVTRFDALTIKPLQ